METGWREVEGGGGGSSSSGSSNLHRSWCMKCRKNAPYPPNDVSE